MLLKSFANFNWYVIGNQMTEGMRISPAEVSFSICPS